MDILKWIMVAVIMISVGFLIFYNGNEPVTSTTTTSTTIEEIVCPTMFGTNRVDFVGSEFGSGSVETAEHETLDTCDYYKDNPEVMVEEQFPLRDKCIDNVGCVFEIEILNFNFTGCEVGECLPDVYKGYDGYRCQFGKGTIDFNYECKVAELTAR